MPCIRYKNKRLNATTLELVRRANDIIREYVDQGFRLTLRQLYYQFVARDLMENSVASYKRLGHAINGGRLAGLIDWTVIEDRTRNAVTVQHWDSPRDILETAAGAYRLDKWRGQKFRPEVLIEKEALTGVIADTCSQLDVGYLACRGYLSQSEMWALGQRVESRLDDGQITVVVYLGDHDPSGIDMTRDVSDRLEVFGRPVEVNRVALNMDQVDEYRPPANPAKITDSRFDGYVAQFGRESWELDALDPKVLISLISERVLRLRDDDEWAAMTALERQHRLRLEEIADAEN